MGSSDFSQFFLGEVVRSSITPEVWTQVVGRGIRNHGALRVPIGQQIITRAQGKQGPYGPMPTLGKRVEVQS